MVYMVGWFILSALSCSVLSASAGFLSGGGQTNDAYDVDDGVPVYTDDAGGSYTNGGAGGDGISNGRRAIILEVGVSSNTGRGDALYSSNDGRGPRTTGYVSREPGTTARIIRQGIYPERPAPSGGDNVASERQRARFGGTDTLPADSDGFTGRGGSGGGNIIKIIALGGNGGNLARTGDSDTFGGDPRYPVDERFRGVNTYSGIQTYGGTRSSTTAGGRARSGGEVPVIHINLPNGGNSGGTTRGGSRRGVYSRDSFTGSRREIINSGRGSNGNVPVVHINLANLGGNDGGGVVNGRSRDVYGGRRGRGGGDNVVVYTNKHGSYKY